MKTILTCEHAGNEIPKEYQILFEATKAILMSHRAYDLGAFDLFQELKELADFSEFQNISRLMVEMNRSLFNSELFSEFSIDLPLKEKSFLLESFYFPYRNSIEKLIEEYIQKGENVLHFSVHSFTPEWKGAIRNADVGLLFDPHRPEEKAYCERFRKQLLQENPSLIIKYNYPYRGTDDGFTTFLRKKFPERYCGIELEVNQRFVQENKMFPSIKRDLKRAFALSLK